MSARKWIVVLAPRDCFSRYEDGDDAGNEDDGDKENDVENEDEDREGETVDLEEAVVVMEEKEEEERHVSLCVCPRRRRANGEAGDPGVAVAGVTVLVASVVVDAPVLKITSDVVLGVVSAPCRYGGRSSITSISWRR